MGHNFTCLGQTFPQIGQSSNHHSPFQGRRTKPETKQESKRTSSWMSREGSVWSIVRIHEFFHLWMEYIGVISYNPLILLTFHQNFQPKHPTEAPGEAVFVEAKALKNPMHTKHNSSSFRAPFGASRWRGDVWIVCWWLMEMFSWVREFFVVWGWG